MFVTPIRESIIRRREGKGMTQHQLSCDAGLPGNAIFRIENGCVQKTSSLRAQAIADALGCQIEDIFIIPGRPSQTATSNT